MISGRSLTTMYFFLFNDQKSMMVVTAVFSFYHRTLWEKEFVLETINILIITRRGIQAL